MALNPIFSLSAPKFLFLLLLEALGFLWVVPALEGPRDDLPGVTSPDFLMVAPLSLWFLSSGAAALPRS